MVYVMMGLIQVSYVALNSLRLVFMIKGNKNLASLLSTIEIFIYISGLALVLKNLDHPWGIFVYCASYGIGIMVGTYIEQKMALGYITLQVISENENEMSDQLRARGYGVTTWLGEGITGTRKVYYILAKRKEYITLLSTIKQIDPNAFVVSDEPRNIVGGFWKGKVG
jgi:uncharacterized protein YebE (UPF0316 family)